MSLVALGKHADERSVRSVHTWRMVNDEEDYKEPVRRRVLDFIIRNHLTKTSLRLLSLPGIRWEFERSALSHFGQYARIVGVERSVPIAEASLRFMPGSRRRTRDDFTLASGVRVEGYESSSSVLLCCELSELVASRPQQPMHRRTAADASMARMVRRWSACWVDLTSQLCPDTIGILGNLIPRTDRALARIPVAVSVMVGREDNETTKAIEMCGGRAELIAAILDKGRGLFEMQESFTYTGGGGVKMLVVMGNGRHFDREARVTE